jgi:hypothetical protein
LSSWKEIGDLAALKLLISPDLAPESEKAKFKRLSHQAVIPHIKKIPITVAPSRDAAAPVILSKHTHSEVENWSPVMQARFYADRVADGVSIADLAKEYSLTQGQITDFIQNYQMYQVACALDLPANVAAKVNDPRGFPLTNLERIFRHAEATDFLGVSFDSHKQIKGHVQVDEFKKAFKKVVTDVALGDANSRNLNSAADFKRYLSGFGPSTPDKAKKGSFGFDDLVKPATGKSGSAAKKITLPTPKPPKPQLALIAKTFVCEIADPRINSLISELKRLSVKDYPNSVALALRGLLDLVVGNYCDRIGATPKILERARTKDNKPKDWYPTVRQMLNYLIAEEQTLKVNPLALKAAKLLVNDQKDVSVVVLDAFAHNRFVSPTESNLRAFWMQIEECIKAMLAKDEEAADANSK